MYGTGIIWCTTDRPRERKSGVTSGPRLVMYSAVACKCSVAMVHVGQEQPWCRPNLKLPRTGVAQFSGKVYIRSFACFASQAVSNRSLSQVLRLFTAKQLEIAVAGEPQFDVAFWKEHTEYKGYRADDDTVDFFWKVRANRTGLKLYKYPGVLYCGIRLDLLLSSGQPWFVLDGTPLQYRVAVY